MAIDAGGCACFSLCHPEEVRHFFNRLPIVTDRRSPWYAYLLAVYHSVSVPLPFDLRTLGAFYLPLDAEWFGQLRIPWAGLRCNRTTGRSFVPLCARSVCAQWLNLSDARESRAQQWERTPIPHPLGDKIINWPRQGAVRRDKHVLWRAGGLPLKAWSFAPVPVYPLADEATLSEVLLMGDINGVAAQPYTPRRKPRMEPFILMRFAALAEQRSLPAAPWVEVLRYSYLVRAHACSHPCRLVPSTLSRALTLYDALSSNGFRGRLRASCTGAGSRRCSSRLPEALASRSARAEHSPSFRRRMQRYGPV